jgi:hypothetical protein
MMESGEIPKVVEEQFGHWSPWGPFGLFLGPFGWGLRDIISAMGPNSFDVTSVVYTPLTIRGIKRKRWECAECV